MQPDSVHHPPCSVARGARFRERKPLFALALSLIMAGMGQVYNGKPRKGILFFAASIVLPFLLLQLSVAGPGQAPIVLLALAFVADPGLSVWAAIDAWKEAKRLGKGYRLKVYNKLHVYILLVVGLSLLFGRFVDWRKFEFWTAPYRMATGSMMPTILGGDFVLTDKRIDRSSENFGLRRGELVVFKFPRDKTVHFVFRIIGLPGDEVELRGMELYVNGKKWTAGEAPLPEDRGPEGPRNGMIAFYEQSDTGAYKVYYSKETTRSDFRISVPEGCCFVLGDNRDISADSRHWGAIALDDIIARPRIVYFSRDPKGGVRWDRIGKPLRNSRPIKSRPNPNSLISQ